jgi:phage shock protein PspC (stress-responsive transcriptional regulator)
MERVVTINLNGNPYQLEEPAYGALRAYLERAEAALADNPDKGEIIRDLEQAIADKCANYLSPGKTVVAAEEMSRILEEMGPVEGEAQAEPAPEGEDAGPRKRLYRIRDGAMIAGVCSGLAAYLNVDVTVVRLITIVLGFISGGWLLIGYVIAMFMIPSAHTSEEWAAAHGVPFNAQEVIDRAKREAGKLAEDGRAAWRRQRRAWRRGRRYHGAWGEAHLYAYDPPTAPAARPAGYLTRVFAGLMMFIFSIVTAALLIAFLVTLFALLNAGAIFDWTPPAGVPLWLVVVIVCVIYAAVSAPFSALRRLSCATVTGQPSHGGGDGLITLLIVAAAAWLAWLYIPEARTMMEDAYLVIRDFVDHWITN